MTDPIDHAVLTLAALVIAVDSDVAPSGGRPLALDLIGRPIEVHLAVLDRANEVDRHVMVQTASVYVLLRQFDLAFVDVIDRADMGTVRADHLGMFRNLCGIDHLFSTFALRKKGRD